MTVYPLGKIKGVGFLACLFLFMVGCDLPGKPNPTDKPVPADRIMEFSVLYSQNCAGCHGIDGKLGPAPPLNDPLFRAMVSEKELEDILTKGRKKTLMPAFAKENGGTLTAAQIQVLVKEIKGVPYRIVQKPEKNMVKIDVVPDVGGIAPKWGTPANPPKNVPSYSNQSANSNRSGNKEKGSVVFARACAVCHGDDGKDTVNTINDRVFLALISDQALRRYVITGRQDLGMPGYAEARPDSLHFVPLTDQEVTDLVALLASWRGEQ